MAHILDTISAVGLVVVLSASATQDASQSGDGPADYDTAPSAFANFGWPRVVACGAITFTIYEPQVDSWDGHQLMARSAVGVQCASQPEPTCGVLALQAFTLVDKTKRTVSLENIQMVGGDFPSAGQRLEDFLLALCLCFPKEIEGLSLDRMEASLAAVPPPLNGSTLPLDNTPPRIIFSTQPAALVYIDGPPAYRPVAGTQLQRVINSPLLLLRDRTGQLYLHIGDGYMTSPNLKGPWLVASDPPAGAAEAEKQAMASPTPADMLDDQTAVPTNKPTSLTSGTAPVIYVATSPTELILFEGQPNFVPIPGTRLLYVANTTGNVFYLLTDQRMYVLISGRWYRAPSLYGPWQFLPADHLPLDFANISDTSPKENVKASVPGTEQATEALIDNSIPEGTKVPRDTQMQNPQIDGPPQLAPIVGTPLNYVVNSGTPIVEVDAHSWYACQNGVWFVATSLNGPWTIADSVPALIYSIPPDSPLHYLTYVQVYGATPETVYEGYAPGYLGTEVENGVVVYGTGYDYSPWIGSVWYGWPCTYGFGWGPCWTPWDDWCFDFGFGWGGGFGGLAWRCCHPPMPWWGANRNWREEGGVTASRRNDMVSTAANIYARSSPRVGIGPMAGVEPDDGYARAYNSRTGTLAAGQRARVSNVYRRLLARGGESRLWANRALESPLAHFGAANNGRGFYGRSLSGRAAASGWRVSSHGYAGSGGSSHGGGGGGGSHSGGGGGGYGGGGGGGGGHG